MTSNGRGSRNQTHRMVLHGERRQLSVMFFDLVGSTALSQSIDPEDLSEVMRGFEDCCRQVVHRFGGYIDRFQGDGALVLFGYPAARGDDAERAVRAALEMIEAVGKLVLLDGIKLQVHIGIATGLIVVDRHDPSQPRFVGEALNLAARLEGIAEPGWVVLSESTKSLVNEFFTFAHLGTHRPKGFSHAVPAWRVTAARPVEGRVETLQLPSTSKVVGRNHELERLSALWEGISSGNGQAVVISGEPGIGKSRLIKEFCERLNQAHTIQLVCSPDRANSSLYPFGEHLARSAGFAPEDHVDARLRKLRTLLAQVGASFASHAQWLALLLSLPADVHVSTPEEQKLRIFEALVWHFTMLSEQAPLLLIVEDAHWLDPTSEELLEILTRATANLRALIIVSTRLSTRALQPDWHHIALDRLGPSDSSAIIAHLAGDRVIAEEVVEEIVQKTEGIPLFVEELTRMVVESGIPTHEDCGPRRGRPLLSSDWPATLHDLLMARLDKSDSAKAVAQIASVIGREFNVTELAAISAIQKPKLTAAISQLERDGLVFAQKRMPNATFAFKHAMVRDAAYESLLRRDRRVLHTRAAAFLDRQSATGCQIEPEILAHHYTEAALPDLAARHWALAARRALDRSANVEVIRHTSMGIAAVGKLGESSESQALELQLQLLRGAGYRAIKGFASLEVEEAFTRARELASKLADEAHLFIALRGLYGCFYARGELVRAREQAGRILALARRSGRPGDLCVAHLLIGQICFWRGSFTEARQELETALRLYQAPDHRTRLLSSQIDPTITSRIHLGWALWTLGWPDQALAATGKAVEEARQIGQPFGLAMGLFWHAVVRLCRGERAESHRALEELRTITAEHRMAYLGACVTTLEGEALIAAGHLESGVATIRRALSDFRAQQAGLGWPWAMSIIAAGYAENDRFDEGMAVLSEAFAAMRNHGECQWEVELHRLRGELLASCSADLSCKATSSFREAARIARSQNARSLELRTVLSWAKHLASDEAMERLEDLHGSFDEGLDTRDLRHARDLLRSFRSNGTVQTVNPTWPDRGAGWPRWHPPHERRSETDGGANDAFLDGNIRGR